MSSVNDAARRRELRKEKILKNAESRKQKIFGIGLSLESSENQTNQNSSVNDDISIDAIRPSELLTDNKSRITVDSCTYFQNSNAEDDSKTSSEIEKLNDYLCNIPDPLTEINDEAKEVVELVSSNISAKNYSSESISSSELEDTEAFYTSSNNLSEGRSRISSVNTSVNSQPGSSILYNSGERKTYYGSPCPVYLFDHPAAPCLLALLVSLLLTFNFGSLVSHSLLIPFLIWELQQSISLYGSIVNYKDKPNILVSVLMLCGIKKDLVEKYSWISAISRDVTEDFSIYAFTIVIWHLLIGYPEEELLS